MLFECFSFLFFSSSDRSAFFRMYSIACRFRRSACYIFLPSWSHLHDNQHDVFFNLVALWCPCCNLSPIFFKTMIFLLSPPFLLSPYFFFNIRWIDVFIQVKLTLIQRKAMYSILEPTSQRINIRSFDDSSVDF